MYTSYFFSNKLNNNQNLVAISSSVPVAIKQKLTNIKIYKPLCPTWKMVSDYKSKIITKDQYTSIYIGYILDKLDAARVYDELGSDAILLCWERPNKFCHRQIVADWFRNKLEINVEEL